MFRNALHASLQKENDDKRWPPTNQRADWRIQQKIVMCLCDYADDQHHDWDIFVQLLADLHNTQVYMSKNITPFSLVLSRKPPGSASFDDNFAFLSNTDYPTEPQALRGQLVAQFKTLRAQVKTRLASARSRYKRDNDKNVRRTSVFAPWKMVYINKPPMATPSVREADKVATRT